MSKSGIVIAVLCFIIFVSMFTIGVQGDIRVSDSKYCEWGEPLLKDGKIIGCQHDSGYIGDFDFRYETTVWQNICFVIGMLGMLFSVMAILITADNAYNGY